jgi:apolipoprotein N-acyltransferase
MLSLAHAAILASGWRRNALALAAGAVGGLAMAPVDLAVALIVPMSAAVWLIDGTAEGRQRFSRAAIAAAAMVGWWWGFGYFLAGLWWLGAAFLVEADKWAWAMPLGVVGLPACLALFPALGFAIARLLWSAGAARILALACGLGSSEWLRGHLFSGFPWNNFGMAFGGQLVLGQAAALVGINGLTVLAVACCASPATLVDGFATASPLAHRRPSTFLPVILAGLAAVSLAGFGALRLSSGAVATIPGVRLRIMQPSLLQDDKFRPENRDAIVKDYLSLSDRATSPSATGIADATQLIWPESAFPFILSRDPQSLARIGAALPSGTSLITGAARLEPAPAEPGGRRFFNSIQVVQSGGIIGDTYDKVHLVPFGEYLPASGLLRAIGLQQFVHIPGGFEAGTRRRVLNVPGLPPVVPLVCYEIVFSGEVMPDGFNRSANRKGLFLNLTNDGWFGHTPGPYQHLAQARLRSIEEGLPMVRAANTGISAVIDPYGRILASLPLGVADVLDSPLPQAIAPTLFSRFGTYTSASVWLIALMGAVGLRRRW